MAKKGRKTEAKTALEAKPKKQSVAGKIAATGEMQRKFERESKKMLADAAASMKAGIKEIEAGVQDQEQENAKALAKMNAGVKEIEKGVKPIIANIKAHRAETNNAAKAMLADGAARLESGVEAEKAVIGKQAKENNAYIKDFYFG